MIYALAARNGEKPGGKAAARVIPGNRLESPHESVLRDLARIGAVAAALGNKSINAALVPGYQLLESDQRTSLRLPGQFFIRE